MPKSPKVSFVVPTYNAAAWLPAAVESCRNQTYQDIEVVIVDDGSTDSTHKYLAWLAAKNDKRIKILRQTNKGRAMARNVGNKEASGDIICVLDADDISYPKRAEITVKAIEKGAQFVYGSAIVMDAVGRKVGEYLADVFDKKAASQPPYENRIVHSTVAYTRELAAKYPYCTDPAMSELGLDDWAMQTALHLEGVTLTHVPNVLSAYRNLQSAVTKQRDQEKVNQAKAAYLATFQVAA